MKALVKALLMLGVAGFGAAGCSEREETTDRLLVWTTESDPNAAVVMARLESEFERQNPGVDLVVETVSWNDLSERLINASHSGAWPDVSHIQPFMAASLHSRGDLLPLTDVRDAIEEENGPIFPAVRDLQEFKDQEGHAEVYGIAYAVGTTFWSVRADRLPDNSNLSAIKTWADYINLMKAAQAESGTAEQVTLPGSSPFFMDQLFAELVANAGGNLFDEEMCPALTSTPVVETLRFFHDLKEAGVLANDWPSQTYADQFHRLAAGEVLSVPVTYARASQTVRADYEASGRDVAEANDRTILWLDQPTLQSADDEETSVVEGQSIATIDAEPWVIFSSAALRRNENNGETNDVLAKKFLRMYYSTQFYPEYTRQVPVHLTPIFRTMATDPSYVEATRPFEEWHRRTLQRLTDGSTRPILMTDLSDTGRNLPFLLEFQRAGILSKAISDVIQGDVTPEAASQSAQRNAVQLVRRSANIDCGS